MGKGEATREAILEHAVGLARRVGLEGLTIGRLADDLELSKSGLFAHFKSKEALQVQVLEAAAARFVEMVVRPALEVPRGEAASARCSSAGSRGNSGRAAVCSSRPLSTSTIATARHAIAWCSCSATGSTRWRRPPAARSARASSGPASTPSSSRTISTASSSPTTTRLGFSATAAAEKRARASFEALIRAARKTRRR